MKYVLAIAIFSSVFMFDSHLLFARYHPRRTVIIHHYHSGGGGGLGTGILIGSMLSRQPQTVMLEQPTQQVVAVQQSSGHGFFWYAFWILLFLGALLALGYWLSNEKEEPSKFD